MKSGWFRESYRHSLAAKGIKTNLSSDRKSMAFISGLYGAGKAGFTKGITKEKRRHVLPQGALYDEKKLKSMEFIPGVAPSMLEMHEAEERYLGKPLPKFYKDYLQNISDKKTNEYVKEALNKEREYNEASRRGDREAMRSALKAMMAMFKNAKEEQGRSKKEYKDAKDADFEVVNEEGEPEVKVNVEIEKEKEESAKNKMSKADKKEESDEPNFILVESDEEKYQKRLEENAKLKKEIEDAERELMEFRSKEEEISIKNIESDLEKLRNPDAFFEEDGEIIRDLTTVPLTGMERRLLDRGVDLNKYWNKRKKPEEGIW